MPSGPRLVLDGACYHIIAKGNHGQIIFKSEDDFERYLIGLKKYKKRYDFKLYGYCLMINHVHILGEIDDSKNLSKFMHGLTRSYTAYFNKKYKITGQLWQGRFKSKVIIKDDYLIDCINYIELNPVRANIVRAPHQYFWSSYGERALEKEVVLLDKLSL